MKKFRAIAASVAAAAAVVAGAALPAEAASFAPRHVQGGYYTYNDGQDRFCVGYAGSGRGITVTLTPSSTARGPKVTVSSFWEDSTKQKCVSLARAYEDTRYTAKVVSWVNGRQYVTSYSFYS